MLTFINYDLVFKLFKKALNRSRNICNKLRKFLILLQLLVLQSLPDHDLIAAILHGLPEEFESFIDSIMLRMSSTSLDELHGLLLTNELSMTRRKQPMPSITTEPFQAFSMCNLRHISFPLLHRHSLFNNSLCKIHSGITLIEVATTIVNYNTN